MSATKTKPSNGKPKQKPLPGCEQPKNEKIERLADRFADARDEWQAQLKPMQDAHALLQSAMKEAKLKAYELPDGRMVEVVGTEKVRVRKPKSEGDDGEE